MPPTPLVINADPGVSFCRALGVPIQSPSHGIDTSLNITFDCEGYDINGDYNQGIGVVLATAYGSKGLIDFLATATALAVASGTLTLGGVVASLPGIVIATAFGDLVLEVIRKNWVKWSDIGSIDFTITKGNVSGERPLDWKGWIYKIKKLRTNVIVYGENGVSILSPSGKNYGLETIYRIGLKGKNAVDGNESKHFFIDKIGQLWGLSDGLKKFDYSEHLKSLMSNVVLSYDELNDLLYICDGIQGFVYHDGSLGEGPINVTGLGYQDGNLYVAAPATIVTRIPGFCTDIYDLGTRKGKTITSLEIGTDLTLSLQAAIDYRHDKARSFYQTPWYDVDRDGNAFIDCFGHEFRFRVRLLDYQWYKPDYIIAHGSVNAQ